jgi:hypothetical protein
MLLHQTCDKFCIYHQKLWQGSRLKGRKMLVDLDRGENGSTWVDLGRLGSTWVEH